MKKSNKVVKRKKVYISLPISGYDLQERKEYATLTEIKLRGRGYDVFNPLGDQFVEGRTTHEYMKRDLQALLDCDAIIFLRGWNRSAGCKCELDVATAIGIDVWFEDLATIIEL